MYAKTGCTVDIYTPKGFIKILMRNVERQEGEACKTFGDWRRLSGRRERRRRGHLDSEGSGGGYEYIYTPPHTIPPPPLSLCSKDAPIHTNKKRQPKPAFPHPHSNYSVPSPAAFSALPVVRPLPPATAFSTFSRRATKSSKSSPTRASTYWLSNT